MENPSQPVKTIKIPNYLSNYRQRILGIFFILVAIFIKLVLTKSIEPGALTTFATNINERAIQIPNWIFNTRSALDLIAGLCVGLGLFQIIRGFKTGTSSVIGLIGILVVLGFLVWGASGTSISFTGMLAVMVIRSVPITIGGHCKYRH
jgi:hypothetical protein